MFGQSAVRERAHDAVGGGLRPKRKTAPAGRIQAGSFIDFPLGLGRIAPGRLSTGRRLAIGAQVGNLPHSCLLACYHAFAVGAVLLAVQIAGMRRRVEREMIERRDVVLIHAVAERRSVGESRNQNSGERPQADIDDIVVGAASAEGPAGVVAAQWAEAALLAPAASERWSDRCG